MAVSVGTVGCLLSYFFIPVLHLAARAMVPERCRYEGWACPSVRCKQWLSRGIAALSLPLFCLLILSSQVLVR